VRREMPLISRAWRLAEQKGKCLGDIWRNRFNHLSIRVMGPRLRSGAGRMTAT
jgi:hypothetical protein